MDYNYQNYINRVAQMTLPNNYLIQLQNIQKSSKFIDGKATKFPGFSIINPPAKEEKDNQEFYQQLEIHQQKLIKNLDEKFFTPIPPSTYHLTIADLIWEQNYLNFLATNPNFDSQLITNINSVFKHYQETLIEHEPLELELLGISVFTRAIAVCFVPTESSYEKIVNLRREIYQNQDLIKLGIEQQYDFVAHITLGYFGEILPDLDLENISTILTSINDEWLENPTPILKIHEVQLRKFEDMITYQREEDWAVIKF